MWLGKGPSVPHGIFYPTSDVQYVPAVIQSPDEVALSLELLSLMAGADIVQYPMMSKN